MNEQTGRWTIRQRIGGLVDIQTDGQWADGKTYGWTGGKTSQRTINAV